MDRLKLRFEVLSSKGFRALAVITEDDRLLLAPGVTPQDLPGLYGQRVRERLGRHEIVLGDELLSEPQIGGMAA